MKDNLTREQSAHLINLGVPEEMASMTSNQIERGEVYYNDYYQGIFTFTDLLEILPKEINNRNDINMEWHSLMERYVVGYGSIETSRRFAEELIDALYELTVWCIENGHLKF